MEQTIQLRLILGTNIRNLRKKRGWTILELATRVESDVGNISRIERGKQGCSDDMLRRIAKELNVDPADLYRDTALQNVAPAHKGGRRVPVINSEQAGALTDVMESIPAEWAVEWIETDIEVSRKTFAYELQDSSMQAEFQIGDKVIIDGSILPEPGDRVLAKTDRNLITFRVYRPREVNDAGIAIFELAPLNPDFPTARSDQLSLTVIGVMVEHRRYRRRR